MVTLRYSHDGSLDSKGVGGLLLDKSILISTGYEHVTSFDRDRLKYVQEKPDCYNICKKGKGVRRAGYKTFEAKLMVPLKLPKGGKASAY
jgi:hypothetical protein